VLNLSEVDLQRCLQALYQDYLPLQTGEVATYIPELAKVNPDQFAICIATTDGKIFEIGDSSHSFTIQSISKVLMYGLALEDHGRELLLANVGVEPTGDAFNAIILDEQSKRPYNPMVNAGAIATTSLIKGGNAAERLNRMLAMFELYTGHEITIDMSVFMSERITGNRNRAMAYLMLNFGMIHQPVDEHLDLYFQQCSVRVTCRDLAVMAATLAHQGVNPITTMRALPTDYVKDLLSVMYTCGMYNFAGEWAYRVGLPAKSGVSGGILAVVPGKMGIGVFSPRLDRRGNSLRGVKVCESLSETLHLHLFAA
jgi:glutaminase